MSTSKSGNYEIYPIDEIERLYPHWFSKGAQRFFNSRWSLTYYRKGNKGYFISSEKYECEARLYTIREFDFDTKSMNTIGKFQEFTTKREALKCLKEKLLEE